MSCLGPAETLNPTPNNSSPPMSPPKSPSSSPMSPSSSPMSPSSQATASESPPHQSDSDWSDWVRRQAANQQGSTGDSESLVDSEGEEMHPAVKDDDGGKRGIIRRKLWDCEEALDLNLRELDEENPEGAEGKRKRKRGQKSDVRRGRGMAKHRNPAAPECRPELMVVGDAEFTSHPLCTKVVTTIRILTLENLPGPYRTYNMFPTKARLEIVKKFLQRYSWAEGEDVKRCLEVFEKIASEAYGREFTVLRKKYDKKYGKDKEVWKDFPPQWCKNPVYWKGLVLIWSKEKWSKVSSTNRDNKIGEDGE